MLKPWSNSNSHCGNDRPCKSSRNSFSIRYGSTYCDNFSKYSSCVNNDTLFNVLFDVCAGPARFWKKYRSCGGSSPSGVGERLFLAPFGLPARRFGVSAGLLGSVSPGSAAASTDSLTSFFWYAGASGVSFSSSNISSAKRSDPSQVSSSSCSCNSRALFFFADRSAFRARVGVGTAVGLVGVVKRALAFALCVGVFNPDSFNRAGVAMLDFRGVDFVCFDGVVIASGEPFVPVVFCLLGVDTGR